MALFGKANAAKRSFVRIEDLRTHVMDLMRSKPGVTSVTPDPTDPAKFTTIAGDRITSDLTNLFHRIRSYPDEDADQLIAQFTGFLADTQNRNVSEENLVAVLRTRNYVELLSQDQPAPLSEPLAGELNIVYMADMPDSMSAVKVDELPGKTLPQVREIAFANVKKWLDRVVSDDSLDPLMLYYIEDNTMLSPTLILLDEFWASIPKRYSGDVLIAMPRRDQLFIVDDNASGKEQAQRIIEVTLPDDFAILSGQLFARRGGKIVVVE